MTHCSINLKIFSNTIMRVNNLQLIKYFFTQKINILQRSTDLQLNLTCSLIRCNQLTLWVLNKKYQDEFFLSNKSFFFTLLYASILAVCESDYNVNRVTFV